MTVHYNYAGNWTGLFSPGSALPPPDTLTNENIYRFPNSSGYDGQFYHYIAHDPFLQRGFASRIDAPRFRYRRILVPVLAWVLAAGNDRFIHIAYFALILFTIFLAALWTSALAQDFGRNPAWGCAVLLVPAVAVSMDRMTVDCALIALIAGIVFYARRSRWGTVWVLCVLACLVRESGFLVPAAILFWTVLHRRFRITALIAITPLPAVAWYWWLTNRTGGTGGEYVSPVPFLGLLHRFASPYA